MLGPDKHGKSKCVTVHFRKFWITDLDNFERDIRSGLHFPNAVGYVPHSQSPERKSYCANEMALSSIPTPAKPKTDCPKSPLVNLLECIAAQRKKSLSARMSRKKQESS